MRGLGFGFGFRVQGVATRVTLYGWLGRPFRVSHSGLWI